MGDDGPTWRADGGWPGDEPEGGNLRVSGATLSQTIRSAPTSAPGAARRRSGIDRTPGFSDPVSVDLRHHGNAGTVPSAAPFLARQSVSGRALPAHRRHPASGGRHRASKIWHSWPKMVVAKPFGETLLTERHPRRAGKPRLSLFAETDPARRWVPYCDSTSVPASCTQEISPT